MVPIVYYLNTWKEAFIYVFLTLAVILNIPLYFLVETPKYEYTRSSEMALL